jgi:uncharacterized protein
MNRRGFLVAVAEAVASAGATASVRNAYRFAVTTSRFPVAGLDVPMRLALLADLHFGPFIGTGSIRAWVDAALASEPDLVLLGGDLVDRFVDTSVTPLVDELARLVTPAQVFAVWGNHDYASRVDLGSFQSELEGVGIELMTNHGRWAGGVYLAGVDDFRAGRPSIADALAERPPGAPCVILTHNPDVLPDVPLTVDLTVAGHTHGGQVCPPGIGPIFTSSLYGRRFASGWVHGPATGFVSRGLGFGYLPVRIGCPAELSVIDLVPAV